MSSPADGPHAETSTAQEYISGEMLKVGTRTPSLRQTIEVEGKLTRMIEVSIDAEGVSKHKKTTLADAERR